MAGTSSRPAALTSDSEPVYNSPYTGLWEGREMAGIRVLLVDDEEKYLAALVKRLELRQVDARGATRGREALDILEQDPIDVVILDVRMPDMDGLEVLKEIKDKQLPCEVVLLTGYASMEVAVHGMELGAFDYTMKPIDLDELLNKIEDAHAAKVDREARAGLEQSGQADS
jgi:DNA-binding NtrC family response regulator